MTLGVPPFNYQEPVNRISNQRTTRHQRRDGSGVTLGYQIHGIYGGRGSVLVDRVRCEDRGVGVTRERVNGCFKCLSSSFGDTIHYTSSTHCTTSMSAYFGSETTTGMTREIRNKEYECYSYLTCERLIRQSHLTLLQTLLWFRLRVERHTNLLFGHIKSFILLYRLLSTQNYVRLIKGRNQNVIQRRMDLFKVIIIDIG